MSTDTLLTLDEIRATYATFKGNCMEMNEARLTTALGDLLNSYDTMRGACEAALAEFTKLYDADAIPLLMQYDVDGAIEQLRAALAARQKEGDDSV